MTGIRKLPLVAAIVLATGTAKSTPAPILNVVDMVNSADLIVVGSWAEGVPPLQHNLHALIHVDRVLKGVLPRYTTVIDLGAIPESTHMPPTYRMFMLHARGANYELADHGYTNLVASPIQALPSCIKADPIHNVACELTNVLMLPERTAINRAIGLVGQIRAVGVVVGYDVEGEPVIKTQAPSDLWLAEDVYDRALEALKSIPFDVSQQYLRTAMDKERNIGAGRPFALACLIEGGDLSEVAGNMKDLMNPRKEASVTNGDLVRAIEGVPDVDGLEAFLGTLMTSTNRDIREGAAERLAVIDTPSATRRLEIGLNDPDFSVRQKIVLYICGNTNICELEDAKRLAQPENIPKLREALHHWVAQQAE